MSTRIKRLEESLVRYFISNYGCPVFFALIVIVKIAFVIIGAWMTGRGLIPWLDSLLGCGNTLGGLTRVLLIICVSFLYFAILRSIYLYKPIQRDRLMFARLGWGMVVYSFVAIVVILCYIISVALITLQADAQDLVFSSKPDEYVSIPWGVLSQFSDPGNLPHAMGWGKFVALLSAMVGVLGLSGLVISSLVNLIARRTQYWKQGLVRYGQNFQDYVVIIGINEQTATIIKKSLNRRDVSYVLVQTRKNVEEQRAKLELKLDRKDEERVVFYYGERTLYEDIDDLRVENAREVYVLGEDMYYENEQDHDSFNMKCLELISQYCEELSRRKPSANKRWWGTKLKCHVELEYQSTYTIFKSTHIYKRLNQSLEFVPFNVYEIWAKKVLVDNYAIIPGTKVDESLVQRYLPIDCYKDLDTGEYRGIDKDSNKAVHLVVIGMNQMGVALAMQAALMIHLPNYHNKGIRTTVTFIDEHAVQESEFLMGRYSALFSLCRHRTIVSDSNPILTLEEEQQMDIDPMNDEGSRYHHLGNNFMDVQWQFVEGNVASSSVQEYLVKVAGDPNRVCTIAVCQDEPQKSIATALYLPEMVLKRVHQVLVYQRNNFDLINKVATGEKEWKRYDKLKPFGMITDCYKGDMFDSILPKLVLSLYKDKNHKIKIFSNVKMDYFIDYINRIWSEEGIVNKLSNINVTDCFKSKLRSVGLTTFSSKAEIEKVLKDETMMDCLEAAEHYRWLTERLTMGYRPLDKDEIDFFLNPISETAGEEEKKKAAKERKAKKEYYKSKSRAHLDICSFDMLDKVDPGVKSNDARIIKNLIDQTFYTVESRIISRLALREEKDNVEKSENLQIAALFLRDMVKLPPKVTKQKDDTSIDVPPLWVGKYPVTQRLWKRIMGRENNPSFGDGIDLDEHPVNNVSKEDVEDFILILNDITGLRFSLPTKSEWKHAALGTWRATQFSKQTKISEHAWFMHEKNKLGNPSQDTKRSNGSEQTHPVGLKNSNKYGLHDMLGNVWEWTQTKHGASTFVFCGGSWRYSAKECDLSDPNEPWCNYWTPEHKSDDLGFRLVLHHSFTMNSGPKQEEMIETKKMISNIIQHLVQVPSGEFFMGTNDAGVLDGVMKKDGTPTNTYIPTLSDERPAHMVKMSGFMISDIPVTQRHYSAFMEENPSEQKGDDLPVENVSYRDALAFIKQLNEYCCGTLLDKADVPAHGIIFSLPTQAQWEYAGREAKSSQLSYTVYSGSNNPDVVAWHYGNTKNIHPVGMKSPNGLKIYDMCGNVWEWCSDWYQADYYTTCCEEGVLIDPKGPESGVTRVLRGGSWRFTAGECRLTRMAHWTEDYKANDVGFRLVANVDKAVIDKLNDSIKKTNQE